MKFAAPTLLAAAFFFNFTSVWLAHGTRFSPYATWYMLQGWLVAMLWSLVWYGLRRHYKRGPGRRVAELACGIGAAEGLTTAIPRLFVANPADIPRGVHVVDYVTGLPVEATLATFYLLMSAVALYALVRSR